MTYIRNTSPVTDAPVPAAAGIAAPLVGPDLPARERMLISGTSLDDDIWGSSGPDRIEGGEGNDRIHDHMGDNLMLGGAGNDTIAGTGTFRGGPGNDILVGSGTFLFDRGDGRDQIGQDGFVTYLGEQVGDTRYSHLRDSVLRFGAGIDPASIVLVRRRDDLEFDVGDDEAVTVSRWFVDRDARLGAVEFADGTHWSRQRIAGMALHIAGTGGDDTLEGGAHNDTIVGEGGRDIIFDDRGWNMLFGDEGDDLIMGSGGLAGGAGDDILVGRGHLMDNTYFYDRGDGHDQIFIHGDSNRRARADTMEFSADLDVQDLWFQRRGDDLVVTLVGGTDGVTINDWYLGPAHQVARFRLGADKVMGAAHVDALVQAMSGFSPPQGAGSVLETHSRQALAPVLATSWSDTRAG
ncbi:calcium-binding protein [Herbaspirillum sp. YR522]|uniref:calcium-binding protein n=1 Tax=Herbaspirillum sp. YR522 TaxID=1144342 RepID=UPI00026FBCB4|nr:calcium-binding protein [Herbaspirillum sp. YR522]EJM95755.1 hemolysin-type calcium-binding protein [Herbaspirillum sp. YR522]